MSEQAYFWLTIISIGSCAMNVIALIDAIRMRNWAREYRKSCEVNHASTSGERLDA